MGQGFFSDRTVQIASPLVQAGGHCIWVMLFGPRSCSNMGRPERIRALHLQACPKSVTNDYLTNTWVRQRFELKAGKRDIASRLIAEAKEDRALVPDDPTVGRRHMRYLLSWARDEA